jgi:hypothetical protein
MSPLEELQAAHKRLSELRDAQSRTDKWWTWDDTLPDSAKGEIWADYPNGNEARDIGQMKRTQDAELIVTLHRTIDAQLAILDIEIGWERAHREFFGKSAKSSSLGLNLARAINGGDHDHPDEAHDHHAINGEAS